MFAIDEDELDIDLDDEEFLLAACEAVQPSDSKSSHTDNVTSKSTQDTPLQTTTTTTAFSRKPFGSLENSTSLSMGKRTQFHSPGNNANSSKPAGSWSRDVSPTCTNNKTTVNYFNKTYNSKMNLPTRAGPLSQPPAKRFAPDSNKPSSAQNNSLNNSYNQRTPNNCNNLNFKVQRDSRTLPSQHSKYINSPQGSNCQGLNGKNTQNCSSNVFSGRRSGLGGASDASSSSNTKSVIENNRPKGSKPGNAAINVTPSHTKTSRKFPGPAGILPKLTMEQNLEDLPAKLSPLPSTSRQSPVLQHPVSPQLTSEDEEFTRDPWVSMLNEYQENVPATMRYSIIQVIAEAACQRLRYGKVPSLCVLVKTFSHTETDSSIFLKDPTGEMHGTLHKRVLEEYQTELGPGAGLILKQVSVFSPSPRKHYLNITPGNIIEIYPPDPSHINSSQLLASQATQSVSTKQRSDIEDPDIILESFTKTPDKQLIKETSQQNSENFNELLEGLDDDDILDEDLLAMY